jgi:hypothetical protein
MSNFKGKSKSPNKTAEMEKRPMFDYRFIKLNTPDELQFEEARANVYMARYKLQVEIQEKIEAKYVDEIKTLKRE